MCWPQVESQFGVGDPSDQKQTLDPAVSDPGTAQASAVAATTEERPAKRARKGVKSSSARLTASLRHDWLHFARQLKSAEQAARAAEVSDGSNNEYHLSFNH